MADHRRHLADSRLGDLIEAVASGGVSPGAGAAGAISLALAAACAGKAVAITLKRRQVDETLTRARAQLAEIARRALVGADEDASRFEDFIHDQDAGATARLLQAEERLQGLADALLGVLRDVEPRVDSVMAGDIAAAKALCEAFMAIQAKNLEETRRAGG